MSHNSSNPEQERVLSEAMKKMFGEFPNGRLNEDDQGAIPIAIGHQEGRVTMQFPRNLNWIGFTADQAVDIANTLIEHARIIGSKKPLEIVVGLKECPPRR